MGVSAIAAALDLGIPVTSSFHTNFHEYSLITVWASSAKWCLPFRWVHNRTWCTMVPTTKQMRELAEHGYRRVRLLSRGIDGNLFSPGRRDSALRVGCGRRYRRVNNRWPGCRRKEPRPLGARPAGRATAASQYHLLIVGDGPYRDQLSGIEGVHGWHAV